MMPALREVRLYREISGKSPFEIWLNNLNDKQARWIIKNRVDRLERGLIGSFNFVGKGVFELKINFGPGYRIYFGYETQTIILLLCGGDKSTQSEDIQRAIAYWLEYKRRK